MKKIIQLPSTKTIRFVFFSSLLTIYLLIPNNAKAIFIYDNGEYQRTANVEVMLPSENPETITFYAYGPQTITFASEEDSGWICEELSPSDIKKLTDIDIYGVEPKLNITQKVRASFDIGYLRNKYAEASANALEEALTEIGSEYKCSFSFQPAVKIDDNLKAQLKNGIKVQTMMFRNYWSASEIGSYSVSWGYSELKDMLFQLTSKEDRDDQGFWVRNNQGITVFRCQDDEYLYPCWHAKR